VQVLLNLDRMAGGKGKPLGVLKLTIQQYFRINGESTQARGVVPDILLPDASRHIESGERYLDHAIPWSAVDPLQHVPWVRGTWDVEALARASAGRTAEQAVFKTIAERAAYFDAWLKQTRRSLTRDVWQARRDENIAKLESLDPKLSEGKPRFEVKAVDYAGGGAHKRAAKTRAAAAARLARWKDQLSRDPWLEESLYILSDMVVVR